MRTRANYAPGAAAGASVKKSGDKWTLVLVRELGHSPSKVWRALTEPEQLREWAPFDVDGPFTTGASVNLSTIGTPTPLVAETIVSRAVPQQLLEYNWGGNEMRWELEPTERGTRLTLWHNIDKRYIAMGAAGWHICIDVLDHLLGGEPIGRIVAGDAMKFQWKRLHDEYSTQFSADAGTATDPSSTGADVDQSN